MGLWAGTLEGIAVQGQRREDLRTGKAEVRQAEWRDPTMQECREGCVDKNGMELKLLQNVVVSA